MANKDLVNKKMFGFDPDYVVPPGETLFETIEHMGMSQAELADRTGRPKKTINEIIKGKAAITPETALQFERVLGVPASFWNNLERNYREKLAQLEEKKRLQEQIDWLAQFPIRSMIKFGWIKEAKDEVEQLQILLNFFSVASFEVWVDVWEKALGQAKVAFRQSNAFNSNTASVTAWLRKGQIEAQKISCQPFSSSNFRKTLKEVRNLTIAPPEIFVDKLTQLCASSGVAVIFVPELPKCRISGATYWINSDKAVIQLSLRYKTDDHLWFTFFHEAGHVLQNVKKEFFLEGNQGEFSSDLEDQANIFAAEQLIPHLKLKKFIEHGSYQYQEILSFANTLGIAPGIIVGRLQFEGVIPYNSRLNELKRRFTWVN